MLNKEQELIKRYSNGDDKAAIEILNEWGLPNTKSGIRRAGEIMIEKYPGFPDRIVWNEPHDNQTALNIFSETHKVKNNE